MTNLISTNGYKLLIVGVPGEAKRISIERGVLRHILDYEDAAGDPQIIVLGPEGHSFVGTIKNTSPLVWDFDPEKYVHKVTVDGNGRYFVNYIKDDTVWCFNNTEDSFLSLLEANGWVKDNPFGEKPDEEDFITVDSDTSDHELMLYQDQYIMYNEALKQWQEAEARRWKQLVIVEVKEQK